MVAISNFLIFITSGSSLFIVSIGSLFLTIADSGFWSFIFDNGSLFAIASCLSLINILLL